MTDWFTKSRPGSIKSRIWQKNLHSWLLKFCWVRMNLTDLNLYLNENNCKTPLLITLSIYQKVIGGAGSKRYMNHTRHRKLEQRRCPFNRDFEFIDCIICKIFDQFIVKRVCYFNTFNFSIQSTNINFGLNRIIYILHKHTKCIHEFREWWIKFN